MTITLLIAHQVTIDSITYDLSDYHLDLTIINFLRYHRFLQFTKGNTVEFNASLFTQKIQAFA